MNKLSLRLAAAIAACILSAPAVLAQPMPPKGMDHPGRMEGHGPGGHPRLRTDAQIMAVPTPEQRARMERRPQARQERR